MKRAPWIITIILTILLAACGSEPEPTPTPTPRPTNTPSPLPTLAEAALPMVESGGEPAAEPTAVATPTDTPVVTGQELSPVSPVATPEPTIVPSATPDIEAQAPLPVLAADLSCGEGCNAGNPAGLGLAVLVPQTGQFNVWVTSLDPLEDEEYEGWLVQGSRVESSGRFNTEADGSASAFGVVSGDARDVGWERLDLTIEPEPDDSDAPATPHSVGGSFRVTVMGEALYNRFDTPCAQCHGPAGEGGVGPVLAATGLIFDDFLTAVRSHQDLAEEDAVATRDLQHMYAWLTSSQP